MKTRDRGQALKASSPKDFFRVDFGRPFFLRKICVRLSQFLERQAASTLRFVRNNQRPPAPNDQKDQ